MRSFDSSGCVKRETERKLLVFGYETLKRRLQNTFPFVRTDSFCENRFVIDGSVGSALKRIVESIISFVFLEIAMSAHSPTGMDEYKFDLYGTDTRSSRTPSIVTTCVP